MNAFLMGFQIALLNTGEGAAVEQTLEGFNTLVNASMDLEIAMLTGSIRAAFVAT